MTKEFLSKCGRVCERGRFAWVLAAMMVLSGCSGGSAPVSVTLSTGATQALDQGQTVNITAAVAHDSNAEGVTWAIASGPGALTGTGKTSVTYSANGATGTAVVTATSVKDKSKTAKVTITVAAMPSITTTSLAAGTEGTAYAATVADTGGAGTCAFTISAGSLPAGLTMSSSGAISGTPTGPNGTANFTVKVTDQSTAGPQSATQALSIVIDLPAAPTISTTTLPPGTEGAAYNQQIAATGFAPLVFSVSVGNLPAGLTMSNAGLISGTPTGPTGTANFTVKVTDASNPVQSVTQALAITVNLPAPPSITTTTFPAGTEGTAYNQTVAATGGLGTLTFSISAGSLPAGLAMDSTGKITGTPTGPNGTANFTVQVKDQSNPAQQGTKALSIVINLPAAPTIGPTSLPNGNVGSAYSQTLTVSGGLAPYTWSVSAGTLPAGLTLAASGGTATISGTPTTQQSSVAFTVQVADSSNPSQKGTQAYTVTIGAALPLTVTTTTLAAGTVSVAYSPVTLQATGGYAPYSWLLVSPGTGPLPPGLALSTAGVISGTPTTAGTYPFTVQVTDSKSATATANLSITVAPAATGCGTGNESILNGQYAFSLGGYTVGTNGIFVGAVGSFTADGSGHITAGTVDTTITPPSESITASSSWYTLGSDYRGCATIAIADYTFTTHFALDPTSHTVGTIQEWDPATSTTYIAAGKILKQTTPLPASVPNGAWVFLDTGFLETVQTPPVWGRNATIGGVTVQNGSYTGGIYYSDAAGTRGGMSSYCQFAAGCSFTTPDPTTGRFTTFSGTYQYGGAKYLVSATQALELVDSSAVGEWRLQTGTPSLSSNMVYLASGAESSKAGGVAAFGLITASGSTLSFKAYEDDAGTWQTPTTSCAYTIDSNGVATPNGWSCSINSTGKADPIFALTGPNTGFVLIWDSNVLAGELYPQSSTSITAGTYFAGTQDADNQNVETITGAIALASGGAVSGTLDRTSQASPQQANQALSDTATANSDGTFTLAQNPGVIGGVIVSKSLLIVVNKAGHSYPTVLVIRSAP